jgi:hypothetical protein
MPPAPRRRPAYRLRRHRAADSRDIFQKGLLSFIDASATIGHDLDT